MEWVGRGSGDGEETCGQDDSEDGEDHAECDGWPGDSAGNPPPGAELADVPGVAGDADDVDEDAECDQEDSREGGAGAGGGLGGGSRELYLAKEEAEASDGESQAHESESRPYPCEQGPFGSEVDARILFGAEGCRGGGIGHGRIID